MAPTLRNGSVSLSVDRRTRSVTVSYHVPLKLACPSDPALGVADLGLVGEVAGDAHPGLDHGAPRLGSSRRLRLGSGMPAPSGQIPSPDDRLTSYGRPRLTLTLSHALVGSGFTPGRDRPRPGLERKGGTAPSSMGRSPSRGSWSRATGSSRCRRWRRLSNGPSGSHSRPDPGSTRASMAPRSRSSSGRCSSRRV
jgi:hypothetical protein